MGNSACSGSEDPVIAEPACYEGEGGALGLTEAVAVSINDFADGAGSLDFSGSGIIGFTCNGKKLTKSGQDISLEDSSDCLPSGVEVSAVKYCSDSDQIKVTVKDTAVPIPVSALLSKVACSGDGENSNSCSGSADPVITEPTCYQGKGGALGLTETVTVKMNDFADGQVLWIFLATGSSLSHVRESSSPNQGKTFHWKIPLIAFQAAWKFQLSSTALTLTLSKSPSKTRQCQFLFRRS